jgi:hypothetical protein
VNYCASEAVDERRLDYESPLELVHLLSFDAPFAGVWVWAI